MRTFLFLFSFLFLISCGKRQNERFEEPAQIPDSIGSEQDEKTIHEAVDEIQTLGDKLGLEMDFKSFPIRVVEAIPAPLVGLAYCELDENGKGLYIGILKSTLDNFHKGDKSLKNSMLFIALVHEFGHCIYNRGHEDNVLSVPGYEFYFEFQDGQTFWTGNVGNELPISVMGTKGNSYLMIQPLPPALKSYYLAEVSGMTRWKSIDDIKTIPEISLKPVNKRQATSD